MDREYLVREYVEKERSPYDIAAENNTYPNKIRRLLKKYGITIRDKSKAQKVALDTGRHSHPTKGKARSEATKSKIGKGVSNKWSELAEETKKERVEAARKRWESMSDDDKKEIRKLAAAAVRKASVDGSKLEQHLLVELRLAGYTVEFHKEKILSNEGLQIDLFLPNEKIIIEVDGPTHFLPIWGQENLNKHILADNIKTGLLLSSGYVVVRVQNLTKAFSKTQANVVLSKIVEVIEQVKKVFPPESNRLINIEIS